MLFNVRGLIECLRVLESAVYDDLTMCLSPIVCVCVWRVCVCGGGGGASVCDVRKRVRVRACVYYWFSVLCECFWLLLIYSQTLLVRLFLHQCNGRSQARRQYKPITCKPTFPILLTPGGISFQNYNAIRITTYMYAREVRDLCKDFV